MENDLTHRNIGLYSDVRQAKDRSYWRVATVTLLHEILPMMMLMIFMMSFKMTWFEKVEIQFDTIINIIH